MEQASKYIEAVKSRADQTTVDVSWTIELFRSERKLFKRFEMFVRLVYSRQSLVSSVTRQCAPAK
jgi:hypothetical protein